MGSSSPLLFIQCSSEQDLGDRSKSDEGQVDLVRQVLKLLSTPKNLSEEDSKESEANLKVTILSPYTKLNKSKHYAGACLDPSPCPPLTCSRDGRAMSSFSRLCDVMLEAVKRYVDSYTACVDYC